ncbi:MAG: LysM peptidoglycan-binding domain-containing protein [Candidatus Aminicenantes bacterium]|nr:MAG: LysM peptidoglycan-binding domain-containing protein [Candidatus Aminicenantes bacterium]
MGRKRFFGVALLALALICLWSCSIFRKTPDKTPASPLPTPEENMVSQAALTDEQEGTLEEENNQTVQESLFQEDITNQEVETKEEKVEKVDDPQVILEETLYAYQDAQLAWDKGDLDTALAALDEAYSLILKLRLPPDSPLIQEKNELRLMIAQRIQEIYASQQTAVGNNHQSIPIEENEYVLKEIKLFQEGERKLFELSYKRSGCYRKIIVEELNRAGLPEELSWMPMIESWFNTRAYSRARALGLWQFIASTGNRFGLKRDRYIDERMDPIKSTRAAVKYLTELHRHFGDWTTALAAYNCGEYRVQRIIRSQAINYLDNFWDLYLKLPRETARFVPRFIATLLIINNPEKYGFNLSTPDPPLQYETISINKPVRLSSLSEALGLETEELATLNPELRQKSTPDGEYLLKVPVDLGEQTLASINTLPRYIPPLNTYINHYVRRGETLSEIAERYGTSVSAIARLTGLRSVNFIRPGQRLKIPARGSSRSYASPPPLIKEGEKLIYVVRRGDSLSKIARDYNTTIQKIKEDNSLRNNNLDVGQKIVIQSGKPEGSTTYTVKSGDTPFEIARAFGMNLNTFLRINGLSRRSKIYPGQELWVIPKD